jgi:hypothetical protein
MAYRKSGDLANFFLEDDERFKQIRPDLAAPHYLRGDERVFVTATSSDLPPFSEYTRVRQVRTLQDMEGLPPYLKVIQLPRLNEMFLYDMFFEKPEAIEKRLNAYLVDMPVKAWIKKFLKFREPHLRGLQGPSFSSFPPSDNYPSYGNYVFLRYDTIEWRTLWEELICDTLKRFYHNYGTKRGQTIECFIVVNY